MTRVGRQCTAPKDAGYTYKASLRRLSKDSPVSSPTARLRGLRKCCPQIYLPGALRRLYIHPFVVLKCAYCTCTRERSLNVGSVLLLCYRMM